MEQIGHLIAALSASHIDHNINICPLGECLLHNSLSSAKTAGNGCRSALGQGEESVNDPLPSAEGNGGCQLFGHGPGLSHRPLMHHGDLGSIVQDCHGLLDGEVSAVDLLDGSTLEVGWDHDLMLDEKLLLNPAYGLARFDNIALLHLGIELPLLLVVDAVHEQASADEVP